MDNQMHSSNDIQAANPERLLEKTGAMQERRVEHLEKLLEATEAVFNQHLKDIQIIHKQEVDDLMLELGNAEAAHSQQLVDYQALHDERNATLVNASRNQVDVLVEKLQRATVTAPNPCRYHPGSVVEGLLTSWREKDEGQDIAAVIAAAKEKRASRQEYRAKRRAVHEEKHD